MTTELGQNGSLILGDVCGGSVIPGAILGCAAFTAANNTMVGNYTADSGFGQMMYGSGGDAGVQFSPWIQNNKAQNANLTGATAHCVGVNLIANDLFDIQCLLEKGASWGTKGGGILARSNHASAADTGYDFVYVAEWSQSATLSTVRLDKLLNNSVVTTQTWTNISWAQSEIKTIKASFSGSNCTVYLDGVALGTVDLSLDNLSSPSDDLNDAAHGRMGFSMWQSAVVTRVDDLAAFTPGTVGEIISWTMTSELDLIDDTVKGDPARTFKGGQSWWRGSASAYLDYDDVNQAIMIDQMVSGSIDIAQLILRMNTGREFAGPADLADVVTSSVEDSSLVGVGFTFEGSGALTTQWS